MYSAGGEHPLRGVCRDFIRDAAEGRIEAVSSVEVLQEILHRYVSIGRLDLGCEVYASLVEACARILPIEMKDMDLARDIVCEVNGISARDAMHAAVMLNNGIEYIATFDQGFDRIPGIKRLNFA
jgi:predicted nucleic acid-binding protein